MTNNMPTPVLELDCATIYRNLMAVCLMGTTRGLWHDAEIAAGAVAMTVDEPHSFEVCRAIAHGMAGDATFAHGLLADDATDDASRVALATALLMAGDDAWRKVIDGVLAGSTETQVRQAANGVIDFAAKLH